MNIYFTAATTGDGDLVSEETAILSELKKQVQRLLRVSRL